MKNFIKKVSLGILATLFCGAVTTSCNDDSDENIVVFYDIATLVEANNNGCVFTFRQINDSEPVTLTFPNAIVGDVTDGTRYLIAYTADSGQPYQSGTGNLYALGYVYNGVITEGTSETTNSWATMQQSLESIWRSGEWINIQTYATCAGQADPAKYDLVVDEKTLGEDYPDAYLIYEADQSVNASYHLFYATFNIEKVWSNPDVKGLNVIFMGKDGKESVKFEKSQI